MNRVAEPEALDRLREPGEGRRHRLERVDLRPAWAKHLRELGRDETVVGADVENDWVRFVLEPGGAELELRLIGAAHVERKVGEVAGVTDETVAEGAPRDELLHADG